MSRPGKALVPRRLAQQLILITSLWIVVATTTLAEPAFAIRTGYRCSQCHANRTGGGIRTAFGSVYTQTILPEKTFGPGKSIPTFLPADPDARFAVGGDVRVQGLALFSDDSDDTISAEIPEANIYVEARLLPGRLSLYIDEKIGPGGASAREVFALVSFDRWRGYVKAGKLLPPFGWRLPDDSAFIRQFSGFSYATPDTGIEVGIEPGQWSLHLAAVNGNGGGSDDNRAKQFSLVSARRFKKGRIGVSASNNLPTGARVTQGGIFGGLQAGRLTLLGELDWREVRQGDQTSQRLLGLFEVDYLVSRGLNIKFARDWIDPDRDLNSDGRIRDSLGVEYIPYPFVQLRVFARRKDGPPQIADSDDRQVEFELHLFF